MSSPGLGDPETDGDAFFLVTGINHKLWLYPEKYYEALATRMQSEMAPEEDLLAFDQLNPPIRSGIRGKRIRLLSCDSQGSATVASQLVDELIKENPRDVAALAYRGWLLKRAGLPDQAMASLDAAIAVDPRFPDAHFFRGMVLYQDRKDPAAAVTEFRLFMSNNPPQEMVPLVEDVLRRAMADAGQPVP